MQYFPIDGGAGGRYSHYPPPLPKYVPLVPKMRCTLYGQTPCSHHGWGSSEVPSNRSAFTLVGHATVSNLTGMGRGLWVFGHGHQAIYHLGASWGWLLLTQEFLEVGLQWQGHFKSSSGLNQLAPLCSALPACQVDRGNQWASSILALLSGLSLEGDASLSSAKVTHHFCWVGMKDWVHTQTVPQQQKVVWGPSVLTLGPLASQGSGSLASTATGMLAATGVMAAAGASPADEAAHLFHLFFKNCCCQGPSVGISC